MNGTERLVLWAYGAIVAAWPIRHLVITWIFRRLDVLRSDSPRLAAAGAPSVTAIIPAKDEAATIAACLASVRAQAYPGLDVIVVDDRSTDGTADAARAAADGDPRVRIRSIEHLPAGWTGKTHALHEAAKSAKGDWIWFIDADTRHEPESLSIAMEYARRHGAKLMSLLPEMRCETFWEKVVQPLEGIVLMRTYPLSRVNNDRDPLAFANGQYILVERAAYEAIGGHAHVRDRFVEDIGLARRVKATGRPIRTAVSSEISSTRMYTSLPSLVRGWARILYDAHDRRVLPLVGKIIEPLVWSQTGDVALLAALGMLAFGHRGEFAWWLLGLSLAHQVLKQSVLYRMYRVNSPGTAIYALFYPLAGIVSAWITWKSIVMCRTGRVTWRDTAYGPAPERPVS